MSAPSPGRRRAAAAGLLLLAALALVLRTRGYSEPLWLDEFLTLRYSRGSDFAEVLARTREGYPYLFVDSLYYLVQHAVLSLCEESPTTLRLPSLVASVGALLCAFAASKSAGGLRCAAAGALLLAVHPRLAYDAHNARPYALCTLGLGLCFLGAVRAAQSGAARDRALAWGGALLAVYGHRLFASLLPALLLASLAARGPRYTPRKILADSALAFVVLLPQFDDMVVSLLGGGQGGLATTWAPPANLATVNLMATPGIAVALLAWAGLALARRVGAVRPRASPKRSNPVARAARVFLISLAASHTALLVGLSLGKGNFLNPRYATPLAFSTCLLLGCLVGRWPRPVGALTLCVLALSGLSRQSPPRGPRGWVQEWNRARAAVLRLAPPSAPVLVWSGQVEAAFLYRPEPPPRWVEEILVAPIRIAPGLPDLPNPCLPLPRGWNLRPEHFRYMEEHLAPALENAERFVIVAPSGYVALFRDWSRSACQPSAPDTAKRSPRCSSCPLGRNRRPADAPARLRAAGQPPACQARTPFSGATRRRTLRSRLSRAVASSVASTAKKKSRAPRRESPRASQNPTVHETRSPRELSAVSPA